MAEAPCLGPRARAALHRAIETAITAGRSGNGVVVGKHVQHAITVIETAMVLDTAVAEAEKLSADIRRDAL